MLLLAVILLSLFSSVRFRLFAEISPDLSRPFAEPPSLNEQVKTSRQLDSVVLFIDLFCLLLFKMLYLFCPS